MKEDGMRWACKTYVKCEKFLVEKYWTVFMPVP